MNALWGQVLLALAKVIVVLDKNVNVRKALAQSYPLIEDIRLVDYKVRIIDSASGSGASVRVLIESSSAEQTWQTVGASTDIIEASWLALSDALEWWILRHPE